MPKLPKITVFPFLCNIIRKVSDEVDFLHTYKYESFPHIASMIFDGDGQAFPKFPNIKFALSLNYLKKEVRYEVNFLHAYKYQQNLLQVDLNTLGMKVSYKVIKNKDLQ